MNQDDVLKQSCNMVLDAAVRGNAPHYLDSFMKAERGCWVYLEHSELVQLKRAIDSKYSCPCDRHS